MFVLQATMLCTVLLGGVDAYHGTQGNVAPVSSLVPGALVMLGISRVFFKASEVTDRCARVPSLINAYDFGSTTDFDEERQYVVEYVLHSDAGFHVFEIRLTSAMTLKFAYVCAIGFFTLLTQIAGGL